MTEKMIKVLGMVDEFEKIIDGYCEIGKETVKKEDKAELDHVLKTYEDFTKKTIPILEKAFGLALREMVLAKEGEILKK